MWWQNANSTELNWAEEKKNNEEYIILFSNRRNKRNGKGQKHLHQFGKVTYSLFDSGIHTLIPPALFFDHCERARSLTHFERVWFRIFLSSFFFSSSNSLLLFFSSLLSGWCFVFFLSFCFAQVLENEFRLCWVSNSFFFFSLRSLNCLIQFLGAAHVGSSFSVP